MNDATDRQHMIRALELARRGFDTTHPNPRVGCVLVRDGEVVGEGWHRRAGEPHAEAYALAEAGERARGATAYVTLEPCCHHGRTPPCTDGLLAAGVRRVVAAMEDPNPLIAGGGFAQLRAAGVEVECGLLEAEARTLNAGFVMRATRGRPLVRCKLAMSLDGRTALASGESQWITGPEARHDVQRLRARSSAILTGIGTVLADDPALTVRLPDTERQPLRIVLDPQLDTPPEARILAPPGRVLILGAETAPRERRGALVDAGAEVRLLPASDHALDLSTVMDELAHRELNEIHTECGATLAGALLHAGLVDELVLYVAPILLGDAARGLFRLPALARMAERVALEIDDIRAVGCDWRITACPRNPE